MEIKEIKKLFTCVHPLDDAVLNAYLSHWKQVPFGKKQIITEAGAVEKYMYLVLDGVQRSYFIKEGKEHVVAFTYPPSFSGIPESFFMQEPSGLFLETITDSTLLRLSYHQHQSLLLQYPELNVFFRKGLEILLSGLLTRYVELMSLDIEERFKAFTTRSPHLIHLVPQKHLASYLRIDPTNFSKLMQRVKI